MAQGFVGMTSIFPFRPLEWYASASSRLTRLFVMRADSLAASVWPVGSEESVDMGKPL